MPWQHHIAAPTGPSRRTVAVTITLSTVLGVIAGPDLIHAGAWVVTVWAALLGA
jgi:hypothetical protein